MVLLLQERIGHGIDRRNHRATVPQNALHMRNIAVPLHQAHRVDLAGGVRPHICGNRYARAARLTSAQTA